MKKIRLFILAGLILFSSVGCGKKETATEIMKKVDQKSSEMIEKAIGFGLDVDGTIGISMQGITIKPTFQIETEMDHLTDSSNFKGSVQLSAEMMNERFQMNGWIVDGMMYTDSNGKLDTAEFDLSQVAEQSASFGRYITNQDIESLYKDFTVEKTKEGYILKKEETDFSSELNMIKMFAALGSAQDQAYLDVLQSFNIRSMITTISVSKDYDLENMQVQFLMDLEIEGQKMELELDMKMSFDFYENERVEIPDLSKWYVGSQNASCVIEQAGLMKLDVDLSATNDEIDKMNMKITIDASLFDGVDFSTLDDDAKAQVEDAMLEQLGLSADTKGLTTTVEFTDTMVVNVDIDLKAASKEDLNKIGLDIDNTDMSFKRFLEDSEKEGYTCTKN